MRYFFRVYGFEITKQAEIGTVRLYPRSGDFLEAQRLAADPETFNLTAIGELTMRPHAHAVFDLRAALTFCQQQWVEISELAPLPDETNPNSLFASSPVTLDLRSQRQGAGALIIADAFDPQARPNFLRLCLDKLGDPRFDKATGLRKALFRNAECFRLHEPFIDVTYYMNFSALEILARTTSGDYKTHDVAKVITPFLQGHGFKVDCCKGGRETDVRTYVCLRNTLFHNGGFETLDKNGLVLRLVDYESQFARLVPDVLLRVLRYNDSHINWDRWLDRMPFQAGSLSGWSK